MCVNEARRRRPALVRCRPAGLSMSLNEHGLQHSQPAAVIILAGGCAAATAAVGQSVTLRVPAPAARPTHGRRVLCCGGSGRLASGSGAVAVFHHICGSAVAIRSSGMATRDADTRRRSFPACVIPCSSRRKSSARQCLSWAQCPTCELHNSDRGRVRMLAPQT